MKISRKLADWVYLLPLLTILSIILLIPIFVIFVGTFYSGEIGKPAIFVGLKNYVTVFQMPELIISLERSFVYAFTAVLIKALLGLGVALMLNQTFRGRGILRGLMIIPWALPAFICAVLFWFVYDFRGVGNYILELLGLRPIHWLSANYAMPSVIIVNVWHGWPFFYLGLLAGLQAIPIELYESSMIDGASTFQRFRYITLPLLKPVFLIVCGLSLMWTLGDFVIPWYMTGGGPVDETLVIPINVYKIAFISRLDTSLSLAYSVVMLPVFLTLIYFIVRKLEVRV